jgi:hypothetical protein
MAVDYGGELVVLGGWIAQGSNPMAEVSNKVFVLRSGSWEELAPLNHARAAAVAGVVDEQIVVAGGLAERELVPQTEVYDGDADEWRVAADISTTREHLPAVYTWIPLRRGWACIDGGQELRRTRTLRPRCPMSGRR